MAVLALTILAVVAVAHGGSSSSRGALDQLRSLAKTLPESFVKEWDSVLATDDRKLCTAAADVAKGLASKTAQATFTKATASLKTVVAKRTALFKTLLKSQINIFAAAAQKYVTAAESSKRSSCLTLRQNDWTVLGKWDAAVWSFLQESRAQYRGTLVNAFKGAASADARALNAARLKLENVVMDLHSSEVAVLVSHQFQKIGAFTNAAGTLIARNSLA